MFFQVVLLQVFLTRILFYHVFFKYKNIILRINAYFDIFGFKNLFLLFSI